MVLVPRTFSEPRGTEMFRGAQVRPAPMAPRPGTANQSFRPTKSNVTHFVCLGYRNCLYPSEAPGSGLPPHAQNVSSCGTELGSSKRSQPTFEEQVRAAVPSCSPHPNTAAPRPVCFQRASQSCVHPDQKMRLLCRAPWQASSNPAVQTSASTTQIIKKSY